MRARFTLVELMVVIAIVAVLAAIALPVMQSYSVDAKLVEGKVNYDGIRTQWQASFAERDPSYGPFPGPQYLWWNPTIEPGKGLQDWNGSDPDWTTFGWAPDGAVRCSYYTHVGGTGIVAPVETLVNVWCDLDGDRTFLSVAIYDAVRPAGGGAFSLECASSTSTSWDTGGTGVGWPKVEIPCR